MTHLLTALPETPFAGFGEGNREDGRKGLGIEMKRKRKEKVRGTESRGFASLTLGGTDALIVRDFLHLSSQPTLCSYRLHKILTWHTQNYMYMRATWDQEPPIYNILL